MSTPLDLLLPVPSAEFIRKDIHNNSDLSALSGNTIDILTASWHPDTGSQIPLFYSTLKSEGMLCLSCSSHVRHKTYGLLQQCRQQLSAQKFSMATTYTSLPNLDAPKLVIPLDHHASAFALRSTLNYRHPNLYWLQYLCVRWAPLLFIIKMRINNFTIIAQK